MRTTTTTMSSKIAMNWVLIILCVIYIGIVNASTEEAPTPAPAPAMDCMTVIYNMSDCLTYVEQGSNTSKPDKACCPELAGLLDSNPICLCQLLGKSNDFPISLDVNRALKLPKVCGLQTPPVSMCSVIGIPVGVPTSSQGPSTAPTSSGSTAPGISPTKATEAEGAAPKNGVSMAYTNLLSYIIASLAIAFTLLSTL